MQIKNQMEDVGSTWGPGTASWGDLSARCINTGRLCRRNSYWQSSTTGPPGGACTRLHRTNPKPESSLQGGFMMGWLPLLAHCYLTVDFCQRGVFNRPRNQPLDINQRFRSCLWIFIASSWRFLLLDILVFLKTVVCRFGTLLWYIGHTNFCVNPPTSWGK